MKRILVAAGLFLLVCSLPAQDLSPALYQKLHWRMIGPFRGGRTRAVAGVPGRSNVFYIGVVNGGVWRTTDYGHTWTPIFDREPTGSIGAIAVAPSNPNIVYVGSGEGLHRPDLSTGDGIYRSDDGGHTWSHLGLRDSQQIPQVAIDPRDPNRVFAAVLGHPYGPNAERGIFRSTDGGKTFDKVLFVDENTGGSDVDIDPSDSNVIYAAMWEAREGPWENAAWNGTNGGIFKSVDGGSNWQRLTRGLPEGLVQANLAIAPSNPGRLYATIATNAAGRNLFIYRSDDAGESWYAATTDARPATRIGGGDLPVPGVDPKNADIVYSASIVAWKSVDGGKTWTGIRGAPGGDDYQNIWINPDHPEIILLASDQGAIITVNGGQTWSTWYNQPTAQLYHATADNSFPYRLCSGQQESGSACISSRGDDGEITIRDWRPVGAEEYGYVAPDPLDPDIVYGGKISRYDRRTGQTTNISPRPLRGPDFRVLRTEPVIFSPADPHTLYFASNTLWKTRDGGRTWQQVSPDLTRKTWAVPPSVGKFRDVPSAKPVQRGVIYAVAPSPLEADRIWAGTDDGLIHLTADGGQHWQDVTPPQLVPFAKVSLIDAGHFDTQTAYAAINTFRLNDLRPHILRTHDGGKTWTEIRNGIPDGEAVNAVREDPVRAGLLFAGTERAVYASFDDGGHWLPLRLNMPATSVRDVIVKDDDLVAATHGRGFWILDDITPLRQRNGEVAGADAFLFRLRAATRVRWNMNTDTPLPPDFPAGENPPDGAIINYWLKAAEAGPVTIEILDAAGALVRRFSSADPVPSPDPNLNIPAYWLRPPQVLPTAEGLHRFVWDLHYAPVPGIPPAYPIAAVYRNTPPERNAPWVLPGQYAVRLAAGGRTYTQALIVRMDPRVKTPAGDLQKQLASSKQVYEVAVNVSTALTEAQALRDQIQQMLLRQPPEHNIQFVPVAGAIEAFDQNLAALAGQEAGRGSRGTGPSDTLAGVRGALLSLLRMMQQADAAPTAAMEEAAADRRNAAEALLARFRELKARDLPGLNQQLRRAGLPTFAPAAQH